jgi:hypothetical protein
VPIHKSRRDSSRARLMHDGDGDLTSAGIFFPPRVHPIEMSTMGSTGNYDQRQKGEQRKYPGHGINSSIVDAMRLTDLHDAASELAV